MRQHCQKPEHLLVQLPALLPPHAVPPPAVDLAGNG